MRVKKDSALNPLICNTHSIDIQMVNGKGTNTFTSNNLISFALSCNIPAGHFLELCFIFTGTGKANHLRMNL
ncbi:hypothetical protein EGR_11173 [Echinococcus granulosus]|uniref:Uncharacterized protein n=1 Tax=Echinococcus granulosus TaxID=6210 RepID=W6TYY0_ECHGR|nr:hypothetical protein EGR_11173 [Echinococcus granulosus]EUB53970.1 hypothetical protein EGR_11173 [Echinococcus granulosus]